MLRNAAVRLLALAVIALSVHGSNAESTASAQLQSLFDREWEARLARNPTLATAVGRHEYDDRLSSAALPDLAAEASEAKGFLAELAAIDRKTLSDDELVSAAIFQRQLENRVAEFEFGTYEAPFNADSGFHTDFASLPDDMTLTTTADYEHYIARLNAWPRHVAEQIVLMRHGLARGMSVPRAVLAGYEQTISAHVVSDAEKSVFWQPFVAFPVGVPAADRPRLTTAGRQAILQSVVPGYQAFLDFYLGEYLPKARTSLGASELPRGKEFYAFLVKRFTTLDITPEEVHEIGLAEVARIRGEMAAVIRQVGFKGSFADFLHFLRTDPRFYPKTGEELLKEASYIAKRVDAKLPSLFGRLPRQPYGVEPVPAALAPKYTAGRYYGAPLDSKRGGTYWVNTYALDTRSLYNLEALTLHEAVPGHHLQGALTKELAHLPNFRRHSYIEAYGEGWGLYSEWLGLEAGFYTDPYNNFGRLTYEMWRACRLVVDTGIHAFGWNRQQVLDYLAANTALSLHEVETETDRYISWPGQALAYKMGQLKILELRRRAEKELGSRFDVRRFHDTVLGSGPVPLAVLEQMVDRWIAAEKASPAG